MDQQQSDYTIRDLVQSLLGAVERFVELIAPTLEQYESIASEIKIALPDGLGEAVAPAPVEPEFSVSAAVCKAIINGERFKQLAKDIDDVLITLTDDDKTFDRRRAASRLIMSMIERFVNE